MQTNIIILQVWCIKIGLTQQSSNVYTHCLVPPINNNIFNLKVYPLSFCVSFFSRNCTLGLIRTRQLLYSELYYQLVSRKYFNFLLDFFFAY